MKRTQSQCLKYTQKNAAHPFAKASRGACT